MHTFIMIVHILACVALILIVLLQTGRGAEMGAAFGGASQTLFGGSGGATFLGKLTTAAAVIFMVTCLTLSYFATGPQTRSIMEKVPVEKTEGPALPEAKPVQPMTEPAPAAKEPVKAQEGAAQPAPVAKPQEPAKEAAQPGSGKQEKPIASPKP
jgi:preprotein translocase subunit SecG